jgi:hypothetical protein
MKRRTTIETGGGTQMFRKLAMTVTLVLTTSLAFASGALAAIPKDAALGSAPASATPTTTGFPWEDVAFGVALAGVIAVCVVAAVVVGRNRRRSIALHT